MNAAFEQAVKSVLSYEGGYLNDPDDPGGETNLGISKRSFPSEDIAGMTVDRAKHIYLEKFWNPIHGNELSPSVAFFMLDTAVNLGVHQAVLLLQRASYCIADGIIGPVTVAASQNIGTLDDLASLRIAFYHGLKGFPKYGKGWLRRTSEVLERARTLS